MRKQNEREQGKPERGKPRRNVESPAPSTGGEQERSHGGSRQPKGPETQRERGNPRQTGNR